MRSYPTHSRFASLLALAAGAASAACYPVASVSGVQAYDTVTTAYDIDAGFTGYTTFSIPALDSGVIPEIAPDGGASNTINHQYDQFILDTIKTNFINYGYTYVEPDALPVPSFTVLVGANATTYTSYYYPYYYWGAGYPWYGYGWYPYPVYTQYDIGTLLFGMQVPDDTALKLNGIWIAGVRGVLSQGSTTTQDRLQTDINQAFIQSAYLDKANP